MHFAAAAFAVAEKRSLSIVVLVGNKNSTRFLKNIGPFWQGQVDYHRQSFPSTSKHNRMRAFSFSLAGCLLLVSAEGRGNDLIFGSRFTRNDMIREPFSWRELLGFRKQSTSTCQQLLLCDSIRGGDGDGGLKV